MTTDDLLLIIGSKEAMIWECNARIKIMGQEILKMEKKIEKLRAGKSSKKEKK